MTLSTSRVAAVCGLLLFFTCSCAAAKRDSRLRHELDQHEFQKPLSEVWPAALRLLAEQQYDLVGKDRAVVGQSDSSNFLRRGFETREYPGRRAMETMQNASGVRYRMEGVEIEGRGCRVTFFAFRRGEPEYDKWKFRDVHMELELVRQIEPEIADRMDAAVK
jgi:hypothetical protein